MAAGTPKDDINVTRFPNGVGYYSFLGGGAAAGNQYVKGIIKARDVLCQVVAFALSGVLLKSSDDYTGECTILSDNYLNNTGGTSFAGLILEVTVARKAK